MPQVIVLDKGMMAHTSSGSWGFTPTANYQSCSR
jgi:hypothetical protein